MLEERKLASKIAVAAIAVILPALAGSAAAAPVVTVAPSSPLPFGTCFPFHVASWQPFAAFFYKNVPGFTLGPGDVLAFDSRNPDGVADKRLSIAMAPTTVNGGDVPAAGFAEVVSNGAPPAGSPGDSTSGTFDLRFTVTGTFSFAGGGLVIRFSNPAGGLAADSTCDGGITATGSGDPSGFFVGRSYADPDGTSPWTPSDTTQISGFQVDQAERCRDKPVTIRGTEEDDFEIRGTSGPDVILTGAGDDVVFSLAGDDTVCGGSGRDEVIGGKGKDLLAGEGGKDFLFGSGGKDKLLGGRGKDYLKGGKGKDKLKGGPGKDREVR